MSLVQVKLIVLVWSQLRQRLAELRVLLLLGIAMIGIVGWLAPSRGQWPWLAVDGWLDHLSGEWPWPAAGHQFVARSQENMGVGDRVTHIWLPEPLLNLAKRERWSAMPQRHEQTRKVLAGEVGHAYFYALRVQLGRADNKAGYIVYVRYPNLEQDNVHELMDVMAVAAGNPPPYRTIDFSNAVVRVVPAGTTRQGLLDAIEAASLSSESGLPSR
jgi:hypothetical protein